LYQIQNKNKPIEAFTREEVEESITFANAVGALVTTKKGAIPAMPSLEEIFNLME
jgi:sugar/nucleoside kinase (ribokinase family)